MFSSSFKPPMLTTPNSSVRSSSSKAVKPAPIPTFPPNSTTNPVVITTQFPSSKTRAISEPKEAPPAVTLKPPSPPPAIVQRPTPTPPPPPAPTTVTNGHQKKTTPPGTVSHEKATVPKSMSSSIFVPPPTVPPASNVRLNSNIEVGRLQMEDLAEKEMNRYYESYVDGLLEEVIQSDFEKPSIPEVILAVITDLTNDDDGDSLDVDDNHLDPPNLPDPPYSNGSPQIYNFGQDKARSSSPIMISGNTNGNAINGEIDYYYTRVQQSVANVHDLSNHDSIRSTNSSNQSVAILPTTEPPSNYLQVECLIVVSIESCRTNKIDDLDTSNTSTYDSHHSQICWTGRERRRDRDYEDRRTP